MRECGFRHGLLGLQAEEEEPEPYELPPELANYPGKGKKKDCSVLKNKMKGANCDWYNPKRKQDRQMFPNWNAGKYAMTDLPGYVRLNPTLKGKCCVTACILAGELQHIRNGRAGRKIIEEKYADLNDAGRHAAIRAADYYTDILHFSEVDAATEAIKCLKSALKLRKVGEMDCTEDPVEIQTIIDNLEKFREGEEQAIAGRERPNPEDY